MQTLDLFKSSTLRCFPREIFSILIGYRGIPLLSKSKITTHHQQLPPLISPSRPDALLSIRCHRKRVTSPVFLVLNLAGTNGLELAMGPVTAGDMESSFARFWASPDWKLHGCHRRWFQLNPVFWFPVGRIFWISGALCTWNWVPSDVMSAIGGILVSLFGLIFYVWCIRFYSAFEIGGCLLARDYWEMAQTTVVQISMLFGTSRKKIIPPVFQDFFPDTIKISNWKLSSCW